VDPLPTTRRGRRPGMTDVARLAGVSQKTVSRVINNESAVSASVRHRVLSAAEHLGYQRNAAARDLIRGRSHRIGVVSLGSVLYGPASLLIALERAASMAGYSLIVATTQEGEVGGIQQAVDSLLDQGVEGIVLSEPVDQGRGSTVRSLVPVVSLGRMPSLRGPEVVAAGAAEGVRAGRVATEHLLGLGHTTVWHVSGPRGWFTAADRARGWAQALAAAGAEEPPAQEGDWTPASGYEAGRVLAQTPGVTAVFVANDEMSIGVMQALNEAGREVPAHVSIVGMDDVPAAAYLRPPLTTVRQDFDGLALRGLRALVQSIELRGQHRGYLRGPAVRLVVRQSTAPPPRG
jgi:DNA-binding LacI/PurR family transcriptional regulator